MINPNFVNDCVRLTMSAMQKAKQANKRYVYILRKGQDKKLVFQVQDYYPQTTQMDVVMLDTKPADIALQVSKLLA